MVPSLLIRSTSPKRLQVPAGAPGMSLVGPSAFQNGFSSKSPSTGWAHASSAHRPSINIVMRDRSQEHWSCAKCLAALKNSGDVRERISVLRQVLDAQLGKRMCHLEVYCGRSSTQARFNGFNNSTLPRNLDANAESAKNAIDDRSRAQRQRPIQRVVNLAVRVDP